MVSVGCSQFGEAAEHQGKAEHLSSATLHACWPLGWWPFSNFGPRSMKDAATVSFSTTKPLWIALWALPEAPLLWHMGVILHSSCALWGAGHSGRWSQAHLSTTQLLVPQGLYFLYTSNGQPGEAVLGQISPPVWVSCCPRILSFLLLPSSGSFALCDLLPSLPDLLRRPIVPQSLGFETQKIFLILLLWHPFPEARMPPGLVDWMKEGVGGE